MTISPKMMSYTALKKLVWSSTTELDTFLRNVLAMKISTPQRRFLRRTGLLIALQAAGDITSPKLSQSYYLTYTDPPRIRPIVKIV